MDMTTVSTNVNARRGDVLTRLPRTSKHAAHCSQEGMVIVFTNTGNQQQIPYAREAAVSPVMPAGAEGSMEMNPMQRNLFRVVMYGLKSFSPAVCEHIPQAEQARIDGAHRQALFLISQLKYERSVAHIDAQINRLFAKLGEQYGWDVDVLEMCEEGLQQADSYSLRKLGITTTDIVDRFIAGKLLPENFYQLDESILEL